MIIEGRTALITGAASGMGRASAIRLHELGANVCILDIDGEAGAALAESLGGRALSACVDVTDEAAIRAGLTAATERFGDIHICCNFAGIALMKRLLGPEGPMPLPMFQKTLDVNLVGTFNVLRLCAERMAQNAIIGEDDARGVIINTASIAAFQGPSGTAAYSASKAALVGLALPLARDLAPYGIRVNTIAPGLIYTAMTLGHDPTKQQSAMSRAAQSLTHVLYPQRFGKAEEVAHVVQFLVENDYINAECIRIDAGKRI